MEQKKHAVLADIALFLTAAIWGFGFLAGAGAVASFPPFMILAMRYGGAMLLMLFAFHKHVTSVPVEDIKKCICLGVIQFVGAAMQLIALKYTTPGKQAFLVTSYVAFVPFISWVIVKRRPTAKAFLVGFITLGGIALLSVKESLSMGLGEGLSILFAIIFGIQIVITGMLMKNISPFVLSFFQFFTVGVLALAVSVFMGETLPSKPSPYAVGSVVYLIVFNTIIAFTVQNIAQKYVPDTRTSLILSTESVFGFLFSAILLGERMQVRGVVGSVLIFGAVLFSKIDWREWKKEKL